MIVYNLTQIMERLWYANRQPPSYSHSDSKIYISYVYLDAGGMFGAMQAVAVVFLSPVTDHWCHTAQLQHANWTLEQLKNISIPL